MTSSSFISVMYVTTNSSHFERLLAGVDFVYHAAALKQVPSCEFHPMEAVKTNVLGTENVLEAAIANECVSSRLLKYR